MARIAFLLLLLIAVASSASAGISDSQWGLTRLPTDDGGLEAASRTCDGLVGECIGDDEEMDMESEISRRGLLARRGHVRFISYGALAKNRVPCNRRGHSYYNCKKRGRANPYRRGCSVITRCARFLH